MNEILGGGNELVVLGSALTLAGVFTGWLASALSSNRVAPSVESKAAAAEARDLAFRTVTALDDFVGACHAAVSDIPEFDPSDPTEFVFHADDPRLLLPRDADWSVLDAELVEELMWMPNRIRNVLDGLDTLDIDSSGFDDLIEHREEDFSRLGIRALDLIDAISSKYVISQPGRPSSYNPRHEFQKRIDSIIEARGRRHGNRVGLNSAESSNITPLFPKSRRDLINPSLDADM